MLLPLLAVGLQLRDLTGQASGLGIRPELKRSGVLQQLRQRALAAGSQTQPSPAP